jgi:hypothetical protein
MHNGTGVGTRLNETPDPRQALPPELREALDREIDPGESLRWCGQPDPRRIWISVLPIFAAFGTFMTFFSVLLIYAGISTWIAARGAAPAVVADARQTSVVVVIVAALLLVGAFWICRQPWLERATARRTVFAVTNTRVFTLVLLKDGRVNLTAFEPAHPLAISRVEHRDGTGTISLNPRTQTPGGPRLEASFVLVGVREPRVVERLIRQTFDPPGVK